MPRRKEAGEGEIPKNIEERLPEKRVDAVAPEITQQKRERERQFRLTPLYFYFAPQFYRSPELRSEYIKKGGVKGYLQNHVLKQELEPEFQSQGHLSALPEIKSLEELETPVDEKQVRDMLDFWKKEYTEWYNENQMDDWAAHVLNNARFPKVKKLPKEALKTEDADTEQALAAARKVLEDTGETASEEEVTEIEPIIVEDEITGEQSADSNIGNTTEVGEPIPEPNEPVDLPAERTGDEISVPVPAIRYESLPLEPRESAVESELQVNDFDLHENISERTGEEVSFIEPNKENGFQERLEQSLLIARSQFDSNTLTLTALRQTAEQYKVPHQILSREILNETGAYDQVVRVSKFVARQDIGQIEPQIFAQAVVAVQEQRTRKVDRAHTNPNEMVDMQEGFEGQPYGLSWNPFSGIYFLRSKLGESPEGEELWYRIIIPLEVDVKQPGTVSELNNVFQEMVKENGGKLQVAVELEDAPEGSKYTFSLGGEKIMEVSAEDALFAGASHDPAAWGEKYFLSEYFHRAQAKRKENPNEPLEEDLAKGERGFKELLLSTRESGKISYLNRVRNRAFVKRVRRSAIQKISGGSGLT
jgi:hypothetical protein